MDPEELQSAWEAFDVRPVPQVRLCVHRHHHVNADVFDPTKKAIEKSFKDEKLSLRVELRDGTAVLTGSVRNVFGKNKAIELALEEPEVEDVEADVEISTAESDSELGKEVVKEIRKYPNLTIFDDAAAIVKHGSVVLAGFVTEPYKKERIEQRLYKILGIQEFDNQIQVLPNSMQDNSLRRSLARRLYRDPIFSDFASMAHPPIRIIVQRSRVLLTGVVNSELARRKAEIVIRQTPGVLTVENRLRVGR